jgi:hypothetical protein
VFIISPLFVQNQLVLLVLLSVARFSSYVTTLGLPDFGIGTGRTF